MKFAVHVGGDQAAGMVGRMSSEAPDIHALAGCSMAAVGGRLQAGSRTLFARGGRPLGPAAPGQFDDWRGAARLLPGSDGAFYAAFWDGAARKLVVVSDFLGYQPLYIHHRPGELRLASETKAFDGEPDLASWGAVLSLGYTLSDQTLMRDVRRVPPATVLTYELATDRLTEERYWQWPEPSDRPDIDGLIDSLREGVLRYAALGVDGRMLLSGGFDSRLLLHFARAAGVRPEAIVVSHRDESFDADARLAIAIARRQGVPYALHQPTPDFFSSLAYLNYVADSDAATPSLYLFIAQVAQFCQPPAMWEGLIPGATLNQMHRHKRGDGDNFASFRRQAVRNRDTPVWRAAAKLFRADVVEAMYDGFHAALADEMRNYANDGWGMSEFIVRNRSRNRTSINPLKVYSNRSEVYCPGLNRDYFNLAGRVAYEDKADYAVMRAVYRRAYREGLDLPVCSGGKLVPDIGGRWRLAVEHVANDLFLTGRRHPRLARWLGMSGLFFSFRRSVFADSALLAEDDAYLRPDAARELAADAALREPALRLLFHWRAWQWLHRGVLFDRLAPHARPAVAA